MPGNGFQPPRKRSKMPAPEIANVKLDPLAYLPPELMINIFLRLRNSDVFLSCSRVCKGWREFLDSRYFWQGLIIREFGQHRAGAFLAIEGALDRLKGALVHQRIFREIYVEGCSTSYEIPHFCFEALDILRTPIAFDFDNEIEEDEIGELHLKLCDSQRKVIDEIEVSAWRVLFDYPRGVRHMVPENHYDTFSFRIVFPSLGRVIDQAYDLKSSIESQSYDDIKRILKEDPNLVHFGPGDHHYYEVHFDYHHESDYTFWKTPLGRAVLGNDPKVVKILLENGFASTPTMIEHAVRMNRLKAAAELVEKSPANAVLNCRNGKPLLTSALSVSYHKVSKKFVAGCLSRGNDVNFVDGSGKTPLMYAVGSQSIEIVRFLISRGANVNFVNEKGEFPLQMVFEYRGAFKQRLEALLQAGANPNQKMTRDWGGETTVLIECMKRGDRGVENVELLLNHGADPNIKDWEGRSASDYAEYVRDGYAYNEVISLLEEHSNQNL